MTTQMTTKGCTEWQYVIDEYMLQFKTECLPSWQDAKDDLLNTIAGQVPVKEIRSFYGLRKKNRQKLSTYAKKRERSLKKAAKSHFFDVGRVVLDAYGEVCIKTLDNDLHSIPWEDNPGMAGVGFICVFWRHKETGKVSNFGLTGIREPLSERIVNEVWDYNFT